KSPAFTAVKGLRAVDEGDHIRLEGRLSLTRWGQVEEKLAAAAIPSQRIHDDRRIPILRARIAGEQADEKQIEARLEGILQSAGLVSGAGARAQPIANPFKRIAHDVQ